MDNTEIIDNIENIKNFDNMFINIAGQQRSTRKFLGIILLISSTILSIFMIIEHLNLAFSLIIFVMYMLGILLMFEARKAVCIGVAMRNREAMTGVFSLGDKTIEDDKRSQNIRNVLKNITFRSFVYSLAITSSVMIVWAL